MMGSELRRDCHLFRPRRRLGNRIAVGSQALDMELDSFTNELLGFVKRETSNAQAREVGHVGAPSGGGLLEDDGVWLHFNPACSECVSPYFIRRRVNNLVSWRE